MSGYVHPKLITSDCLSLDIATVKMDRWFPESCDYRLIDEGKDLYWCGIHWCQETLRRHIKHNFLYVDRERFTKTSYVLKQIISNISPVFSVKTGDEIDHLTQRLMV
ncbi:Uncharacterized conserved protein [Bartonella quintana]|nr:hypothetical protein O93_00598 [Bartonella quintana JK 19]SQF95309.1 Uncharacterized conserved protein [Bartonella quintana]